MPTGNANEGAIFCSFDIAFVQFGSEWSMQLQDRNGFITIDGQSSINQQVQECTNLGNSQMKFCNRSKKAVDAEIVSIGR
jgi:5-deoxy-D-glucuronate isomerase